MSASVNEFPERLLNFHQIPDLPWLPPRREGKKLSLGAIYRWAQAGLKGADGQVHRLKTVRIGGNLATSEPWLREFFIALARMPDEPINPSNQHERAERRLEAVGL